MLDFSWCPFTPSSGYPGLILQADIGLAGRMVDKGEAKLREYQHPDPYIVPYYPGGHLLTGACQQGCQGLIAQIMWHDHN